MHSLKFIVQYIKRHRFQYPAGIITLFIVDFANLFIPRLTGSITDGLTARTMGWEEIKLCLLSDSDSWPDACPWALSVAFLSVRRGPFH